MAVDVILPRVDMDMTTAKISRWLASDGTAVRQGDPQPFQKNGRFIPAAGWSDLSGMAGDGRHCAHLSYGMVPRRADKRSAIRHGWKASGRPYQSSKSAG